MAGRVKRAIAATTSQTRSVRVAALRHIKGQFDSYKQEFPGIKASVKIFNDYKRQIPPHQLPATMRDHRLDGPLKEFKECHLAGDILLLYKHEGDLVVMCYICRHSDLYGKRAKQMRAEIKRAMK